MKRAEGALARELPNEVRAVQRRTPEVPISVPAGKPNTQLAITYAAAALQHDVKRGRAFIRSIYRAFWQRGADISTTAVLAKLATEAGLPAAVVPDDAARAIAHAWQQSWKRTGLGAVPLLVRTDAHTLHGLVDSGQLRDFLTQPAPPEVTR